MPDAMNASTWRAATASGESPKPRGWKMAPPGWVALRGCKPGSKPIATIQRSVAAHRSAAGPQRRGAPFCTQGIEILAVTRFV